MKKLSILFLSLVAFATTVTSCSKDESTVGKFQFQGHWAGTYSGNDDNGTWTGNIDDSGKVTGSATSQKLNKTFELTGNVSASGSFSATSINSTDDVEFKGQMTANNVSGTWKNTTVKYDGAWAGDKQ